MKRQIILLGMTLVVAAALVTGCVVGGTLVVEVEPTTITLTPESSEDVTIRFSAETATGIITVESVALSVDDVFDAQVVEINQALYAVYWASTGLEEVISVGLADGDITINGQAVGTEGLEAGTYTLKIDYTAGEFIGQKTIDLSISFPG